MIFSVPSHDDLVKIIDAVRVEKFIDTDGSPSFRYATSEEIADAIILSDVVEISADGEPEPIINYVEFAAAIDSMRECLSAMVAALVADGFTDREARMLTASMMSKSEDD